MLILCPTRGRPGNAKRLADAVKATAVEPIAVLFLVDNDDPYLTEYRQVFAAMPKPPPGPLLFQASLQIGHPSRIGPLLNYAVKFAAHAVRHVAFLGDDHVPRTFGWDAKLTEAVDAMGGGFAYGNDLVQGGNLPTAIVMSSDVPRTLGHMVPGGLEHLFIDNAWRDLGQATRHLAYLATVIIEHMHPLVGKAARDVTYETVNSAAQWQRDETAYQAWREHALDEEALALRAVWARSDDRQMTVK